MTTISINKRKGSLHRIGKLVTGDGITSYTQKPGDSDKRERYSAHELFSLFTANIIKMKKRFTR